MKRCPGCQTEQPTDAQVCSWCGREISGVVADCYVAPIASERRALTMGAVAVGIATSVKVVPLLVGGVLLYLVVDATAGLVLIGVCLALVALAVGAQFVAHSTRASAGVCGIVAVIALGLAVWLARLDRPSAWFECLIAFGVAVYYFVVGYRKLRV